MAEENESQEKTEDPSQRKLEQAKEDGKVLTSKEMYVFTSLFESKNALLMSKNMQNEFTEMHARAKNPKKSMKNQIITHLTIV